MIKMSEIYLDYNEYTQYGGTLDKNIFDRLEFRSEKIINARINGNICIDEDLKRCIFEIIEYLNSISNNGSISNIKSISNDGYSITTNDNINYYDDLYGINGIINTYLHKYIKPRGISYV